MPRSGRTEPPRVIVLTTGPEHLLREIAAGLEEEGVPYDLLPGPPVSATELAFRAAARSVLEVGVGLDAGGTIVVHHAGLPKLQPVSQITTPTPEDARRSGQDAARVVTGIPLISRETA